MKLITVCATILAGITYSSAYAGNGLDWSKLTLDQLKNIEVTSVSKEPEQAFDAAAAIYVITQEDIRRSGATSIPEALRLAPGVQVARAGSNQWAISIRGFNDQFSNKLLVMIDGRVVYTPIFSGVYWDVQDTLLEDVKQIEVIRGPGATLWGANAVNGVINIITEEAINTTGKFVSATVGNKENGASTRVGGKWGENSYYRVYAKYINNAEEQTLNETGAGDDNDTVRGGFRVDWDKSTSDSITVQGDIYRTSAQGITTLPSLTSPFSFTQNTNEIAAGGNILTRWKHTHDSGAISTLQVYYDNASRYGRYPDEYVNTFDVDFQHSLPVIKRNELIFGADYRLVKDRLNGAPFITFSPKDDDSNLYSFFVQDKISLIEKKLFLTLGTKYEYNKYSKSELQPSARISYLPNDKNTLWASVSRAVKTPDRGMNDLRFNTAGTPFGYAGLIGDRIVGYDSPDAEEVIAYEVGYRVQPAKTFSIDTTIFYNDYDNVISNKLAGLYIRPTNDDSGESYGFEVSTKWEATKKWDLTASYTLLRTHLSESGDVAYNTLLEGKAPDYQYNISSHYKFTDNFTMTNLLYTVGELRTIGISSYTRFDTVLTWSPTKNLVLSLAGQDLFKESHREFSAFYYSQPERIGRNIYASAKLRF